MSSSPCRARPRGPRRHALPLDVSSQPLYAFQYEQIAAYLSLKVLAEASGHGEHSGWIDESIDEERAAAEQVEALIAPVTTAFVAKNGK